MNEIEPILVSNPNRFVIFPIQHDDLWKKYKQHMATLWTADEIDLTNDMRDWENLNDNERFFVKNILAFFAASDGIVNENIAENFLKEVQYPEAKFFYGMQIMMENVHSETYSLLIDTYITDSKEKHECFRALEYLEPVKKKADWALKWVESDSFVERLLAFIAVEGIFFSGSFSAIFWLKNKGLLPGLCRANALIFKDENLHCEFAINLINNHIVNKPSNERIKEILLSALDIEKEFITESLPVSLIGMNANIMKQYLEYVTDQLLIQLGCKPEFGVEQPFSFMEQLALQARENFFEGRAIEYRKADFTGGLGFNEEF